MSKKMILSLQKMADELHVPTEEPIYTAHGKHSRFSDSKALYFLEQNLFRNGRDCYTLKDTEEITINSLKNPREEMDYTARKIAHLVRNHGYHYREIAIVCGDLSRYANYAKEVFDKYKIPLFIDQKITIVYHPFIEFLRAVLEVVQYDFSGESIFRYLRSGLSGISREDVDILENYCLAAGVMGYRKWMERFCYLPKDYDEDSIGRVNEIRGRVAEQFAELYSVFKKKDITVRERTNALYAFICAREAEVQLKQKEAEYEAAGDLKNAKEYAQIYRIVMDLFDKMTELLGDEVISLEDYAKILDAGYESAKVGIIPPGYDRVLFGDMERTRLDSVKILFVVGVNDGVIPKSSDSDGILSQLEREKLEEMQLELAPTVREKTFIQKFYIYLNLTKPSDRLYLSYARVDGEGKAIRSSYLIRVILNMFDNLSVREIEKESFKERIITAESAKDLLIEGIGSAGMWQKKDRAEEIRYWAALCRWYQSREEFCSDLKELFDAAKLNHKDSPISASVTKALYGTVLENSITRLETFAACAFSHFLIYGLHLKERSESGFYAVDFGIVFHDVLERFAEGMQKHAYNWFTVTEAESEELLKEALEASLGANHNLALYDNARSSYAKERIYRILKRTVSALLYQVRKGRFTPDRFEVSFSCTENLKSVNFNLSEEEKMHLQGRIDRIDTYRDEDRLYVKIIDYKSGGMSFQLLNVYYGLRLQLVVYMNAALEMMQQNYPDCKTVPAGIFYYHVSDPIVEAEEDLNEEELQAKIFKELKLSGAVNEDSNAIYAMDTSMETASGINSDVIPVGVRKDGSLSKVSKTLTTKDFAALSSYVNETILHLGQRMMQGDIGISPYELAGKTGCDYCKFRGICHFDTKIPGFEFRRQRVFSEEEALCRMKGEDET